MPTDVGNTTYYSTIEEYHAAGDPGGTETHFVVIGQPPAPGEPPITSRGGLATVGGQTIGSGPGQYNAETAPSYKPPVSSPPSASPPPGPKLPPATISSGNAAPSDSGARASVLKADIDNFNSKATDYQAQADAYAASRSAFDAKWSPYVQGNTFTGSDDQYKEYQKDFHSLDHDRISLTIQGTDLAAKHAALNDRQTQEFANYVEVGNGEYIAKDDWDKLDPKYQATLKDKGFAALDSQIDADNKAAIKETLVGSFDRFKNDKGQVDLTQAVKSGLSEHTIALAFGEDKAQAAVKAAGPAPADGWGAKAPTLPQAVGVVTAETLFPPAKQWVEPELHYKATAMDWAVGGAQLALFALPLVGLAGKAGLAAVEAGEGAVEGSEAARAAAMGAKLAAGAKWTSVGIQAGATAIFTKDTIDHLGELKKNPWQLAFAIGMDALVADGALRAISPKLSPGSQLAARVAAIAKNEKGGILPGTNGIPEGAKPGNGAKGFGTGGSMTEEQYKAQYAKMVEKQNEVHPWDITPEQKAQIAKEQADLAKSMQEAHDALRAGDAEKLKQSARDMLTWSKHNPDSPVADLLDRRANDFIKNAADYARLKDVNVQAKEGPRPIEGRNGAKIPDSTGSSASDALTKAAHDSKASSSGLPSDYERLIEQRISQAQELKQDAFYRDHKLPSWVADKKVGESVAQHGERVRDYLEEQYGRDYIEKNLDLTQEERDAIARDVMKEHLDNAIDDNQATMDEIKSFLKEDRSKEDWRKPASKEPAASEDRGGGTAVKEKTEVKTEQKAKVEQEAEKILEEKRGEAKPKEEVKTDDKTKAGEKTGEKTREEVKPEDKVKPTEKAREKATPFERTSPVTQSKPEPHTAAQEQVSVVSKPVEQTKGSTQPVSVPAVNVRPAEEAKSKAQEQVNPQAKEQVQPAPSGATTVKPVPGVKETPEPKPQPEPQPSPSPQPHPPKVKTETKVKEQAADTPQKSKEWTQEDIENATVLKSGFGWWLKTTDGRQRFFAKLPPGAKDVGTGKGAGYRSAQTIQGKPADTDIKVGFETAHIHNAGREPRKGAVNYGFNQSPKRPGMHVEREGKVLNIKGVGLSRKMPKGRVLKRNGGS